MSNSLAQIRKSMRLTQKDMADILGLSLRNYRDKENKVLPFSQTEIIKISIYLKLSRDEIYKIFLDYNSNKKLFENQNIEISTKVKSKI